MYRAQRIVSSANDSSDCERLSAEIKENERESKKGDKIEMEVPYWRSWVEINALCVSFCHFSALAPCNAMHNKNLS